MEHDVLPGLGTLRIDRITKRDVSRVLEAIAARGSVRIADLALAQTRALFAWANSTGRYEGQDPTRGIRKRGSGQPRERILTDEEIARVWHVNASPAVRNALRLQLCLGLRIGEAAGIQLSEIDFREGLLRLPPTRTKTHRTHEIPLSALATAVIRDAAARASSSLWLFPEPGTSAPSRAVHAKSAQRVMLRLRMGLGSHDLRRTCATRLGDLGTHDEIIARILGHAPQGVTRVHYNRSARLVEQRSALDQWGSELSRIVGMERSECSPQMTGNSTHLPAS